jgi:uncharacterized protein YejL (UPF0352 family)
LIKGIESLIAELELHKSKHDLKLNAIGMKVMADNLAVRSKPKRFREALRATMETLRTTQIIQETRGKSGAPDTA